MVPARARCGEAARTAIRRVAHSVCRRNEARRRLRLRRPAQHRDLLDDEAPDAAARFVAYLTSPEADRLLIEEASQLPYRRALASDARFAASLARSPTLPAYASLVERTRDLDLDPDIVEIFDLLSEAYEAAGIYGVTPVKQALAKAATEARKIIDAR